MKKNGATIHVKNVFRNSQEERNPYLEEKITKHILRRMEKGSSNEGK